MRKLSGSSESVNPSAHLNYSQNANHSHAQLGVVGAPKPDLTVAYVPETFALADDHCYINAGLWCVSTPLTTDEVYRRIKRIGSRPNLGSITIAIKGGAA